MTETKEIPPVWTTGWTDVLNTGTWRSAVPVHEKRFSPCRAACPAGSEIPAWIQQVKEGQYQAAWLTMAAENPFPAVTGRVCHHPCEGACNRREYDGAVAINALEQFIGDLALREGWPLPPPASAKAVTVAVIGGGPAGLSCAYHLRRSGYRVTVFEAAPEPGGVLRYGIPRYRLPREIISAEIRRLLALGIEVHPNSPIRGEDLARLQKDYAALCLATGAPRAKMLPQFPAGDPRVLNGLQFLGEVNQGRIPALGRQVVVIGGGSVAMDVARTARRLGKQVQILALEEGAALPAQPEEVQEALAEGVFIYGGAMVQEVVSRGDQLALACVKVILDPAAPPGVLKPIVIPGTEWQVLADTAILAVGQDPELDSFAPFLEISNSVLAVGAGQETSRPGIFACGDAAGLTRYVSAAVGAGRRAARSIAAFLKGRPPAEDAGGPASDEVSFREINTFYFPFRARAEKPAVAPELRRQDFREVRLGLPTEEVLTQAERCFSCGHCVQCDNCYYFCPDLAVVRNPGSKPAYSINGQYCKGCGLCVEECPRGAVRLKEEKR